MEGGGSAYSSSMAPSGSYILIVAGQPVSEEHKAVILERLNKGLLSWDVESTGCDLSGLETVCSSVDAKQLIDSDVLIQHSTESLGVEVLVNPTVSTLKQCVKNFLSTSTGHKHLIHAGYTFAGSGSWILQNGTFSFDDFLNIFQQADVQNQKRCNINIHCVEIGRWIGANFAKGLFTEVANVAFNPPEKVESVPGSEHLIGCLSRVLVPQTLEDIMAASSLVGNIRFNRPTLYLFPAGQGDCALFGINGFNMLIDGGFNRKPCSWEFIRHLDRLDAVLVTRLCENNVCGMSTLMKRKSVNNSYPQIGYVFCNIGESNGVTAPKQMEKNADELIVSVVAEGHGFTNTLNELKLKPHQCWRDSSVEPFVLYHKVGHGTLEMHVLSPPKDSKEMKEFLSEWSSYKETFSFTNSGSKSKSLDSAIPLSHATSICAILIWRPADPKDTITRILFPGSAPQNKIFESLDKLKALDVLKQPVVTKSSLSLVASKVVHKTEKSISRTSVPNRKNTASPALSVSSVASKNGDIAGVKKEVKKIVKEVKKDNKEIAKKEIVKKEIRKESVIKDVKKSLDTNKKEPIKKDSAPKENKDIKAVAKKDTKDVKATIEKKSELKTTRKSDAAVSKTVSDVKKTAASTVRKSTTPIKKEISKVVSAPKVLELKKTGTAKPSDPKAAKDVLNKKTAEAKSVPKTKPKTTSTVSKSAPKTKPTEASKPGNKMTKAVAASSIVASAVAVTCAAFELNEKKEEIPDAEPVNLAEATKNGENIEVMGEAKEIAEKSEEVNVSPLPPEAVSPTPSESISLTQSDTLSSAPLETVSPTPPLANEPVSIEEKEVNEIKEIDQDLPYERDTAEEQNLESAPEEVVDQDDQMDLELPELETKEEVVTSPFIAGNDDAPNDDVIVAETAFEVQSARDTQNILSVDRLEDNVDVADEIKYEQESDIQQEETNIDEQLAHISMEGSFCAGRTPLEAEQIQVDTQNFNIGASSENEEVDICDDDNILSKEDAEHNEKEIESINEEVMQKSVVTELQSEYHAEEEPEYTLEEKQICDSAPNQEVFGIMDHSKGEKEDNLLPAADFKYESEEQEKDSNETHESEHISATYTEQEYIAEEAFGKPQEIKPLDSTFAHRLRNDDYDMAQNIIDDADMQESSVDEPEEIVRKESGVSITLNDKEYDDDEQDAHRQSCTESEDDVDIQKYVNTDRKDSYDQDRLSTRHDSDSDNDDVVKSPTPHAVVDYAGSLDEAEVREQDVHVDTETAYPTEKHDLDEKERDSAEDQDEDDGEMIRHPTPPEMRYSEEEMRDPIGQHYITGPGLKLQGPTITQQPLYEEESEDAASDRSVSPVVEQPVFGNVGVADFPELVTVSGGTTPSEPQSPKTGLEAKKFTDSAVMDALSEHDCSESSTHSPLCQDGSNNFELPTFEEVLPKDSVQFGEEAVLAAETDIKNVENGASIPETISGGLEIAAENRAEFEKLSSAQESSYYAQSDDESFSQNEKSETRSEKSDAADEKSDAHHDDKSDHQHDGKSDMMDDQKSDMHEDDRYDSNYDDKSDNYGGNEYSGYGTDHSKSHNFESEQIMDEAKLNAYYETHDSDNKIQSGFQDYGAEIHEDKYSYDQDVAFSQKTIYEEEIIGGDTLEGESGNDENVTFCAVPPEEFNIPSGFGDDVKQDVSETFASNVYEKSQRMDSSPIQQLSEVDEQYHARDYQTEKTAEYSYEAYETSHHNVESHYSDDLEAYDRNVNVEMLKKENLVETTETYYTEDAAFSHDQLLNQTESAHPGDIYDELSPQNVENLSGYENKTLTEVTEAHQYETLSKFEDNVHTSNVTYSESSLIDNAASEGIDASAKLYESINYGDPNYNMVSEETRYSASEKVLESNLEYESTDIAYHQSSGSSHGVTETAFDTKQEYQTRVDYSEDQFAAVGRTEMSQETYGMDSSSYSDYSKKIDTSKSDGVYSEYSKEFEAIPEPRYADFAADYRFDREGDNIQTEWSHSEHTQEQVSQHTQEQASVTETHSTFKTSAEETSYIISSRFQSDSPEDNAMRSDSSPDIPPYPLTQDGRLADVINSTGNDALLQTKDDIPNINLPHMGTAPMSPNKAHNANQERPYDESSEEEEEEDSTSAPGTVSPYAYTNQAYAKEEEDIDGNHIYKDEIPREKTEVIQPSDGNNPPTAQHATSEYTGASNYDFRLEEWGKPMGLPTPPDGTSKTTVKKSTTKTLTKSSADTNGKVHSPSVASKMSSPMKKPKPKTSKESSSNPVYVDLAYVPHHGDPQYCDVEFFKKVRARYYVFSGINPSKEVLNALLEAKKSWKEDLEVTIIPTYETDTLGYWMAQNQDDLNEYSIEVAPSASRCTVNLQDHETSCAAYRLEF